LQIADVCKPVDTVRYPTCFEITNPGDKEPFESLRDRPFESLMDRKIERKIKIKRN
jgi:hypothetical protein